MTENLQRELKTLLDTVSRVDERLKIIAEKESDLHQRLNNFFDAHNSLVNRVTILESHNGDRLEKVEEQIHNMIERLSVVEVQAPLAREQMIEVKRILTESILLTQKTSLEKQQMISELIQRISRMEERSNSLWSHVRHAAGLVIQGVWVLIVCYLLYKFGLNTPPLP